MFSVCHDVLPDSYLLVLVPDKRANHAEEIRRALHGASLSGKKCVWVDCSLVEMLPDEVCEVLLTYFDTFQELNITMVLCHANEAVRQYMQENGSGFSPPIVPSLLDAALYCPESAATF
ncbi:hypothetical protein [Hymenobacter sp. BT491]|uniref:hypothetical protein n=1 Tax=Hymenobacter sp. BT491 TaxID=2766779 RepID=UPI0016536B9D|nr:hypothetical protein [Hymenobacter sp. BT491]MBC6992402.1 hypothetical protein [Hymenobacter sp. BT491]